MDHNLHKIKVRIYNRLTIVAIMEPITKNRDFRVKVKCICGTYIDVDLTKLKNGRCTSCGCFRLEQIRKANNEHPKRLVHGHKTRKATSPEYTSWQSMLNRCFNMELPGWKYWGGRELGVCQEWRNSFEAFLEDMGPRPEGTTLGRIDNDAGYFPDNCRWETSKQQRANKRKKPKWYE